MTQHCIFLAAGTGALTPNDITTLFLSLAIILLTARLLGEIARRLGQPAVLGEILAGVVLGPTFLGAISPDVFSSLFPLEGNVSLGLEMFTAVAVTLMLLAAGLEVDLTSALKQGKATLLVSTTGMVFPFICGISLAWFMPQMLGMEAGSDKLPFALFIGVALSITALPVIAKILLDLNLIKSDMGTLIMSSAMINDLIGWIGFAMILAMVPGDTDAAENGSSLLQTMSMTLLFIGVMLTIGRWLSHKTLPWVQAHFEWPGGVLTYVMIGGILCAAYTEWLGIHSIFGAFIAGVAIGDSRHLREGTRHTLHQFIMNIFAPIFFASIGLRVSFVESFDWGIVLLVLAVALIGKIGGCYIGAKWAGLTRRESLAIGMGMSARGAMEIILAQLAKEAGLINDKAFVAIVIMAIVTSLIAGPAMQKLTLRRQKRKLSVILSDKQFIPDVAAIGRREAIAELATQAAELSGLDAVTITETTWQREELMSTGLSGGIATPHARLDNLKSPLMIIGRSTRGVDFDAPDARPAHLICLLLTHKDDPDSQLEMLDMIGRTFSNPATVSDAAEASNYTELLAALNRPHPEDAH